MSGALAVALILLGWSAAQAQTPACPGDSTELERFTDAFFRRYLAESPGPSLALAVVHDGRMVLAKGYGTADEGAGGPVTPDGTVFHVASLSKVATAVALMRLARSGRIELDADVNRYLSGSAVRSDSSRPVTLAHFLTHTSGLEGPFMEGVVDHPADLIPLGEWFATHPLRRVAPPGDVVRYSNEGMSFAGHVVEIVTAKPFEMAMEEQVFAPIGMTSSSFLQPPPSEIASRIATAGTGPVPDALVLSPAGAMVSTAEDMGRLIVEILEGGPALDPRAAAEMRARHWSGHPDIPGVAYGLFEGEIAARRILWHTGARVHFSILALVPEEGLGVFLVHSMRQGGPFQDLRVTFVRALIERCGTGPAGPRTGRSAGGPAEGEATELAGVYRPAILPSTTVARIGWLALDTPVTAKNGGLEVALPGSAPLVLRPIGEGAFTDGQGAYAGFRGERLFVSAFGVDPLTLERLDWYQRGRLHAGVMALAALIVITFPAGVFIAAAFRRIRGRSRAAEPRAARVARVAAASAGALLAIAPIVVLLLVLATPIDEGANGLRRVLAIGLGTLTLAAALCATLPFHAARAYHQGWWNTRHRIIYTAVAAAAGILVLFLLYYRALIFWL